MVLGVSLSIFGIIWLGMFDYLEKGHLFVAYFDESVQGLDKDSPVKYRGVSIGRVDSIGVAPDLNLIQVVMKLEKGDQTEERIDNMVAQLKSVGITGLMFIELDQKQDGASYVSPRIEFPTEYPIIATTPSDISQIFQGIDDVFQMINDIDFKLISNQLTSILNRMDAAMADANIKGLSSQLERTINSFGELADASQWLTIPDSVNETAVSFRKTAESAQGAIDDIQIIIERMDSISADSASGIRQSVESLSHAMATLDRTLQNSAHFIDGTYARINELQRQMTGMLMRMDSLAENMNRLVENVADQPAQLILGEPPAGKKIEAFP